MKKWQLATLLLFLCPLLSPFCHKLGKPLILAKPTPSPLFSTYCCNSAILDVKKILKHKKNWHHARRNEWDRFVSSGWINNSYCPIGWKNDTSTEISQHFHVFCYVLPRYIFDQIGTVRTPKCCQNNALEIISWLTRKCWLILCLNTSLDSDSFFYFSRIRTWPPNSLLLFCCCSVQG